MKIYKQWYNSFGDFLFIRYFISEEKAKEYRETVTKTAIREVENIRCKWVIEEIEVEE